MQIHGHIYGDREWSNCVKMSDHNVMSVKQKKTSIALILIYQDTCLVNLGDFLTFNSVRLHWLHIYCADVRGHSCITYAQIPEF